MANVFKVADMSDRSNLSSVIAGYSSNLAEKKKKWWDMSPVTEFFFSQQKYQSTEL